MNKGAAVRRILEEKRYDLVLVAGDDQTDESMFRLDVPNLVTVRVGHGETRARYQLATPAAFRKFLSDVL
jgi:trehalose-6-phosphatase